ncbi:methylamine utilization protein [Piscinibacter aquaticus]|uniref:Methylamine utilization protein n=1 Tax=Piscinibacter aquaticus TaxID=392597 RepID=A0A5C6U5P7_9BURK|nr:methylamine utilization protein [Piscinibacter aquaticus]
MPAGSFMRPFLSALIFVVPAFTSLSAVASPVSVQVADSAGRALPEAVVLLEPLSGKPPVKPMPDAQLAQEKRQFKPRVTLITVGTAVNFPNFDTVRHHVYSFSKAKTFEIKLYAGVPSQPVVFDKPGIAVLGCNIHDRMAAWVVVADTPWHAMSGADGVARIADAPPGTYQISVWHAGLAANSPPVTRRVQVGSAELRESFQLAVETLP